MILRQLAKWLHVATLRGMTQRIGIRELKDSLSAVLRELTPGAVVDITDRGQVVAHLVAATGAGSSRYEQHRAAGTIQVGRSRRGALADWPQPIGVTVPLDVIQAAIDAERDE